MTGKLRADDTLPGRASLATIADMVSVDVVGSDLVSTRSPGDTKATEATSESRSPRADIGEARDSTELIDAVARRREMAANGYLLVRNVVPVRDVEEVRDALAGVLEGAGLTARQGSSGQRAVSPVREGLQVDVAADRRLFRQLYAREVVHRLPHHPRLLELAQQLLGGGAPTGPLLVHPKPAVRVVFPDPRGPVGATPAHQDHLGQQGTTEVYTLWLALVPCSRETGVLAVVPGSHHDGPRPFHPVAGSRVAGCDATALEGQWVAANLEPGDVIAFHSLTVHQALPNRSGAVRLSIDARYQRASEPVCEATLREIPDLPWEEIYAGWSADAAPLRRYWERLALNPVPFDARRLTPARRTGPLNSY